MFRLAAIFVVLSASTAIAQQSTVQHAMPFDACVQHLQAPKTGLSQTPSMTIDTSDAKQVQYPVTNGQVTGQVTVTCNRSSQQVTIENR